MENKPVTITPNKLRAILEKAYWFGKNDLSQFEFHRLRDEKLLEGVAIKKEGCGDIVDEIIIRCGETHNRELQLCSDCIQKNKVAAE